MTALLVTASWILPMHTPPIRNGWVHIDNGCVVSCSAAESFDSVPAAKDAQVIDMSGHVLLPSLINAHTHLDLAALDHTQLPHDYCHWIGAVVAARAALTVDALQHGLARAVQQLHAGGTTIVGDIVGDPRMIPLLAASPLHGRAFAERIGVTAESIAARYREWPAQINERWQLTPSPHALHTIGTDAFVAWMSAHNAGATGSDDPAPLAIHCAESAAEWELFVDGAGPLRALLDRFQFPDLGRHDSPLAYALAHGGLPARSMLIHCNELCLADIPQIAAAQCTVVHCPGSHAYFSHSSFPLDALLAARVPIALGTDSHGNVATLNMLDCLRAAQQALPSVAAEQLVTMATRNAAQALRLPGITGTITPGSVAHLCAMPLTASAATPYDHVLQATEATFLLAGERILRG